MRLFRWLGVAVLIALFLYLIPLHSAEYDYLITVDYDKGILNLEDDKGSEVKNYPVGLPRITPKVLPAVAWISRIELK